MLAFVFDILQKKMQTQSSKNMNLYFSTIGKRNGFLSRNKTDNLHLIYDFIFIIISTKIKLFFAILFLMNFCNLARNIHSFTVFFHALLHVFLSLSCTQTSHRSYYTYVAFFLHEQQQYASLSLI